MLLACAPGALPVKLADEAPIPTAPARIAVGVPADLLRRRPDVRAAERRFAAAVARIGAVGPATAGPRASSGAGSGPPVAAAAPAPVVSGAGVGYRRASSDAGSGPPVARSQQWGRPRSISSP